MQFDRALVVSSLAKRHLLEARAQVQAAVDALADIEGFLDEYHRAVDLSDELDVLFMAIEDKTQAVCRGVNGAEQSNTSAE